ncbi:hypothetical protein ACFV9E_06320 [Streptomyces sp. NPDC059835]|uniref:hypothetical protein n=1 Tax=Streptomyces sp. NPDC059835 TaxID=3346967 RepID=UPI00364B07CD
MSDKEPQEIIDGTGRKWTRNDDPSYKVYYETRGEPRLATFDHIKRTFGIRETR